MCFDFPLCSSEVHALNIPMQVFVPLFCFPSNGIIHGGFVPGGCVASVLSCKGTGMVKCKNPFTTTHATLRDQCLKVKEDRGVWYIAKYLSVAHCA